MVREREDIERFRQEEKELEQAEPAALGTPLQSAPASADVLDDPSRLFAPDTLSTSLVRAITFAQVLGPPRARTGRTSRYRPKPQQRP